MKVDRKLARKNRLNAISIGQKIYIGLGMFFDNVNLLQDSILYLNSFKN